MSSFTHQEIGLLLAAVAKDMIYNNVCAGAATASPRLAEFIIDEGEDHNIDIDLDRAEELASLDLEVAINTINLD